MGRKQESSGFGVVARTGVSLLALGFGSALFGALVVGPSLGKQLGQDSSREQPATSSTRLASAAVDRGGSTYVSHAREREQAPAEETRAPEPTPEEQSTPGKTEDVSQFVEGTGADTVVPNDPVQVAADSQEPDRSHDEQSTTEPATVKTISEPAVEPERPRRTERSVEKPAEEPRARDRKRDEPPAVAERPRREETRTEPAKRHDDERTSDKRDSHRERRDRTVAAEPESRRDRETTRTKERDRTSDSTHERDDREERKSTRSRTSETSRTRLTETKSDEVSPKRSETVKISATKRPELVKTATAPTLETPETAAADAKLFRVRVGRVQPREDAERLRDEIKDAAGVDAFLVQIGDGYQVQTGAYRRKVNAEKIAAELRSGNFKPRVMEDH